MFAVTRHASKFTTQISQGRAAYRSFSSDVVTPRRGAGLMERLSSFFVGAGLTALVTQFYIFQEIKEGNEAMIEKQKDLEKRVAKLEG
ncbi:unnamed protein product [Cylindrotheca closterium]|uniref:Uncharacterized protein n=1 Tax=Cylindrotheca closterium TaxID=2856 RepID=A0AAD2CJN0_9STRA|nr:unnamed protein product [Cylindrotheca closterium]